MFFTTRIGRFNANKFSFWSLKFRNLEVLYGEIFDWNLMRNFYATPLRPASEILKLVKLNKKALN